VPTFILRVKEQTIIPTDPKLRGLCLLIEQWADESIGLNARKCLIGAASTDQRFRTSLLPSRLQIFLRQLLVPFQGICLGL
jgi:glutathione S-transferase